MASPDRAISPLMNPGPFQRQLIKPPLAQAEDRVRGRPPHESPPFLARRTDEEGLGGRRAMRTLAKVKVVRRGGGSVPVWRCREGF